VRRALPSILFALLACAVGLADGFFGLEWDASPTKQIAGYRIYGQRGCETRLLGWAEQTCWLGAVEQPGLWRFWVTAVSPEFMESDPSNVVTARLFNVTILSGHDVVGPWRTNRIWQAADDWTNTFYRVKLEY
jgi:hypothetical protein